MPTYLGSARSFGENGEGRGMTSGSLRSGQQDGLDV